MPPDFLSLAAAMFAGPTAPKWATPGELAASVSPFTVQTDAMDLIDDALVELMNTPNGRLIITMPPQEGKSSRAGQIFPLWVLTQRPETRVVMVSYSIVLARRNSRAIRSFVNGHGRTLDLWVSREVSAVTEWELEGHRGGVFAVGIGGSLTGRSSDLMIIDDPIKDMVQADSEVVRENVWDWWQTVASTRSQGDSKVLLIQTRWHEDDLAGRLVNAPDGHRWKVLNIPAQADHDPAKGETDPLGRQPGEFMESAQGTRDWETVKAEKTQRVWDAMYQGRPASAGGNILKRSHWKFYDAPLWTEEDGVCTLTGEEDTVIQSWDMAFKDTRSSDYVVGQVWLKRGPNAYLLDQVRNRLSFTDTVKAVEAMTRKWPQAQTKLIEEKANGAAVMDVLKPKMPGLIPITPHESKIARASAVSWAIEAGNVFLPNPKLAPWVDAFVEEAAAFPTGAHDDQVDGATQALNRLMVNSGQGAAWMEYLRRRVQEKSDRDDT